MRTNRFSRAEVDAAPADHEELIAGSNVVLYAPRQGYPSGSLRLWRMGDEQTREYASVQDAWAALDELDRA